jgi:hypothetical protein
VVRKSAFPSLGAEVGCGGGARAATTARATASKQLRRYRGGVGGRRLQLLIAHENSSGRNLWH